MAGAINLPYFKVIPDKWLPALHHYRCVGEDASIIRRHVTNPFYEYLMQHVVPESIAPNLITLIGFCVLAASALLACLMGDYSSDDVPRWVFLVCALCLFFYQTMDNLDGKQARRTGSSSPLGEILDHGCDALGCTLGGVAHVMAAVPGTNAIYIFLIAMSAMSFATWEEYYAGGMFLGPINGPNEALFCIMFTELLTFTIGQRGMTTPLTQLLPAGAAVLPDVVVGLSPATLINIGGFIATLLTAIANIRNVYHYSKNGKHRHGMYVALLGLLPFAIVVGTYALWIKLGSIFHVHPHLCIYTMGISFAYYNTNITLSYILGTRLKIFDWLCIAHLVALLNVSAAYIFGTRPFVDEVAMFYTLAAITLLFYLNFAVSVVSQVSGFLKIPVFSLPPSPKKKKKRERECGKDTASSPSPSPDNNNTTPGR